MYFKTRLWQNIKIFKTCYTMQLFISTFTCKIKIIMKRRTFIRNTGYAGLALTATSIISCKGKTSTTTSTTPPAGDFNSKFMNIPAPDLKGLFCKLSLAQWSLNKAIRGGEMDPMDFAEKAKLMGFSGIEYVNHLYEKSYKDAPNTLEAIKSLGKNLLTRSKDNGIENLLIMIDGQGDLAASDKKARTEGVDQHKKWVDLANFLGCHSIRINLFGDGSREAQAKASIESMRQLCEYAAPLNVNIIVENHGGNSSDPNYMTEVMKGVNLPNAGVLPDFGNFCIEREGGERWGAPCINEYPDYYKAVEMMMPYAKAVSAKSYGFDAKGDETKIDYYKMMKVVKAAGYTGHVGVEYEGETDEVEGIIATRDLIVKAGKSA